MKSAHHIHFILQMIKIFCRYPNKLKRDNHSSSNLIHLNKKKITEIDNCKKVQSHNVTQPARGFNKLQLQCR